MKLYTQSFYNPYFIEVGSKEYCIDSISVFDNNGVIIKNKAWFGSNNDIEIMEINVDCIKKLKIDFKCVTAFIVKSTKASYHPEVRYDLYIPNSVMQLSAPNYRPLIKGGTAIMETRKSATVTGAVFETSHKITSTIDEIRHEINEIGKKISTLYTDMDSLKTFCDRLVELNELLVVQALQH